MTQTETDMQALLRERVYSEPARAAIRARLWEHLDGSSPAAELDDIQSAPRQLCGVPSVLADPAAADHTTRQLPRRSLSSAAKERVRANFDRTPTVGSI